MFLSVLGFAQEYNLKEKLPGLGLLFLSSAADGLNQKILFHWTAAQQTYNLKNAQFWNPEISWENKYEKHPDGTLVRPLVEKFPLSKSALVFTTDGYHLTRSLKRWTMVVGIVLMIRPPKKKGQKRKKRRPRDLIYDGIGYSVVTTAGFNTTFNLIPNIKK